MSGHLCMRARARVRSYDRERFWFIGGPFFGSAAACTNDANGLLLRRMLCACVRARKVITQRTFHVLMANRCACPHEGRAHFRTEIRPA